MSIIQQIRGDQLPIQTSNITASLQISPTGNSEFGKFLPSESAVQSPDKVAGMSLSGSINIEPRGVGGSGMNPLPPDIAPIDASRSGMNPLPPDIAPSDASGSGMNPLPPDIAPSDASSSGNLVIGLQPPDLSGGIGIKSPIQVNLFHSMQSARAYALNSIVDVLDREALGTIV